MPGFMGRDGLVRVQDLGLLVEAVDDLKVSARHDPRGGRIGRWRWSAKTHARFAQVNIVVSDMDRSLEFYEILGVEVADMPHPWGAHHRTVTNVTPVVAAEFDSSVSVGNWASSWDRDRTGCVVGFAVETADEVDAVASAISAAGFRVLQQPHDAFFGARYAVMEDPDGIAGASWVRDTRTWNGCPSCRTDSRR